ncbi:MAG: hypothetical protein KBC27_02265 [Rickettsiales bacterium]|nr:hypothetical protein [Rickettsiales bacterium]
MAINDIDRSILLFITEGIQNNDFLKQDRKNCINGQSELESAVNCLKTESYLFTSTTTSLASTDLLTAIRNIMPVGSSASGDSSLPQTDIDTLVTKFGTSTCVGTAPVSAAREMCCARKYIIENIDSLKANTEAATSITFSLTHTFSTIVCDDL